MPRHRRHGVTATLTGADPTVMSVGSLVLVLTSMVDTVPRGEKGAAPRLVTKAVLPSGVTATAAGKEPTVMSSGCLIRVFTPIVDTVPLRMLVTNAVARHRERAATADAPFGTTPTSAPANANTNTTGTHRDRRIAALPVTGDTA